MRAVASFDSLHCPEALTGCWLWHGSAAKNGYGQHYLSHAPRVRVYAHRFSWETHHGAIPEGMCVCHRCDTPGCVNPDHLFLGAPADNSADMVKKGRQAWGERKVKSHKLTARQIDEILASRETNSDLARRLGVDHRTVSQVRLKRTWALTGGERQDDPVAALSHKGSEHPMAKLTEKDIPDIRRRLKAGESTKEVGDMYGVTRQLINLIRKGAAWAHVPDV